MATTLSYPLVVIGAGAAGLVVAIGYAKAGKKVLLIEEGNYGGDCTNYGCIPSKTLIGLAKHHIQDLSLIRKVVSGIRPRRAGGSQEARDRDLNGDSFFPEPSFDSGKREIWEYTSDPGPKNRDCNRLFSANPSHPRPQRDPFSDKSDHFRFSIPSQKPHRFRRRPHRIGNRTSLSTAGHHSSFDPQTFRNFEIENLEKQVKSDATVHKRRDDPPSQCPSRKNPLRPE